MSTLPVALSLTNSFTQVGAIAGFAALLGIAMLSLLAFSQAREIKRLREWAGRAPERAMEMEQRVSAEAAARVQRPGQPAPPAGARVPSGAQVVPRKTPLVSAPVSTAVNATVAAGKIGVSPSAAQTDQAQAQQAPTAPEPSVSSPNTQTPAPVDGGAEQNEEEQQVSPSAVPAPATAAAHATGDPPRPSLPPSPSSPAPPGGIPAVNPAAVAGVSSEPASELSPSVAANASALPASAAASAAAQAARPPAPVAAARPMASRAVAGSQAAPSGPRLPTPRAASAAAGAGAGAAGVGGGSRPPVSPLSSSGPKYFKPERSPARATAMIVGGVIVAVLVVVLAVSLLKGGKPSTTATQTSSSHVVTRAAHSHSNARANSTNPSETAVVVLNGTSTNGLAHHLASDLKQSGYSHAEASGAIPSGTHATTVVEYTSGHRADGQAVAKALNVSQVQPIEASTASLAGSATVVVLAGSDQASQLGGGGAQGKGEPATGSSGEAGTGAGGAAGEGAAGSGQ